MIEKSTERQRVFSRFMLGLIVVLVLLSPAGLQARAVKTPKSAPAITAAAKDSQTRLVIIGTGGITGLYYAAGGAICRLINQKRAEHHVRCAVESTDGSIENLQRLRTHDLHFGIVQSDWQLQAVRGGDIFRKDGKYDDLRALLSLHAEKLAIIARADSGITRLEDLKGKRVNFGKAGSGQRATMGLILKALNWTEKDFKLVGNDPPADQGAALCAGKYDAMIFMAGHPNGSIQSAASLCPTLPIAVEGAAIDALLQNNPQFSRTSLARQYYWDASGSVPTIGVAATLVTDKWLPDDVVDVVMQAVYQNLELLRESHPAFEELEASHMARDGLSAPLHPAAAAFYQKNPLDNASDGQ